MRPIDAEPLEEILRSRCAQYSNDYGSLAGAISGCLKLVQAQPTIAPPPNGPLTLEQLREMDGEPVWVVNSPTKREEGFFDEWALVSVRRKNAESVGVIYHFENYGGYWWAYRHKPEDGTA